MSSPSRISSGVERRIGDVFEFLLMQPPRLNWPCDEVSNERFNRRS
jgi:hypothetical protein